MALPVLTQSNVAVSVASIVVAWRCCIASRQSMIQSMCCSIVTIMLDSTEGLPGPETVKKFGKPSIARPK